jgi:hypothetical protein
LPRDFWKDSKLVDLSPLERSGHPVAAFPVTPTSTSTIRLIDATGGSTIGFREKRQIKQANSQTEDP